MEDQASTSKDALDDYDWQELENRFAGKMMECQRKEKELAKEFAEWLEVCSFNFRFYLAITFPAASQYLTWKKYLWPMVVDNALETL